MGKESLVKISELLKKQNKIIDQLQYNVNFAMGFIDGLIDTYKFQQDNIKVIYFDPDYKKPESMGEKEKQAKLGE